MKAMICEMCGSNNIAKDQGEFVCRSCGCKYSPEEARKLLVEIAGPIEVKGISSVQNDLVRGNQCLEAKDWDEANKVFSIAVDKQADYFDAWYGLLAALTHQYTYSDVHHIQLGGAKGLAAVLRNCDNYVSSEKKEVYLQKINEYFDVWDSSLLRYSEQSKYYSSKVKKLNIFAAICSLLCLFSIVLLSISDNSALRFILISCSAMTLVITLLLLSKSNKYLPLQQAAETEKTEFENAFNSISSQYSVDCIE